MSRYNIKINLSLLLLLLIGVLNGADDKSNRHWFLYPLGGYAEETSVQYGGVVIFDTKGEYNYFNGQWINVMQYSFKNQLRYITKGSFSLSNDYSTSIAMRVRDWPSDIYELGMESEKDSSTSYKEIEISFETDIYKKLPHDFYVGINAELGKQRLLDRDSLKFAKWSDIYGNEGGYFNGVGFVTKYDTRDQDHYPTKGYYYRLSYRNFNRYIGSDYDFGMTEIDLKNYFSHNYRCILVTDVAAKFCHGKTPFQKLSKLGKKLRGYSSSRYVDKQMLAFRSELRLIPFESGFLNRGGIVFFAETGTLANDYDEFRFKNLKLCAGIGGRFQLTNSSDRMNARCDLAFTDEGYQISISAYEEF